MEARVSIGGLAVSKSLHDLVRDEAAPGTGIDPERFWISLAAIVADLGPENRKLLERRDALQGEIDEWHRRHRGHEIDPAEMRGFLNRIGYLVPEGSHFEVATGNVDPEIALVAGPQLVVPLSSARYALNAANARWGSLYDALYGTDAVPDTDGAERGSRFNPTRAQRVIERTAQILDEAAPLAAGTHRGVVAFRLRPGSPAGLEMELADGSRTGLADSAGFAGYRGGGLPRVHPAPPPRPAHRDPPRSGPPRGAPASRGRQGRGAGSGDHHHPGLRGRGDRSRRRRQDARVPQLARHHAGHARDARRERRRGDHPAPRARPPLHRAGRRATDLAGPEPAPGAQRRRPHVHRRGDASGRRADPGDLPGCDGDFARGGARPEAHRTLRQQPRRQHLHRPAQDARAGGGGGRGGALRPRRTGPRPHPQHPQDRHHGRGAAHHRQPQGVHPRRPRAGRLHQHRLPRPHRGRNPHHDGVRRRHPQGGHQGGDLDPGLRRLERGHRPGDRAAGPGPDREGHVARPRCDGRHARDEDRASESRRQHRVGALPHCRHPARGALPPGRCRGAPARDRVPEARAPRGHLDPAPARPAQSERR